MIKNSYSMNLNEHVFRSLLKFFARYNLGDYILHKAKINEILFLLY